MNTEWTIAVVCVCLLGLTAYMYRWELFAWMASGPRVLEQGQARTLRRPPVRKHVSDDDDEEETSDEDEVLRRHLEHCQQVVDDLKLDKD